MQFLDLISSNLIDDGMKEWFLPGFSTTTKTDEVVAAASAMCTFQDYFTYEYEIICGIPHIRLEGSVADWEKLLSKVEKLVEYDDGSGVLLEWTDLLRFVVGNFVESARNGSTNNLVFWDNVMYNNVVNCGPTDYSGWITVFSFFDKYGQKTDKQYSPSLGKEEENSTGESLGRGGDRTYEPPRQVFPTVPRTRINANILSCPATVNNFGSVHNATLFVGQMTFEYRLSDWAEEDTNDDTDSVVPVVGSEQLMMIVPRNDWALVIEKQGKGKELRRSREVQIFSAEQIGGDICNWDQYPKLLLNEDPFLSSDSNVHGDKTSSGESLPALNEDPLDTNDVEADEDKRTSTGLMPALKDDSSGSTARKVNGEKSSSIASQAALSAPENMLSSCSIFSILSLTLAFLVVPI